ncbi:MAG: ABC transporter ATP-binding protein, partial [Pseudomonadota bacterium]
MPEALGGSLTISDGFAFDQLGYLLALSFLFLFFVICNGAFKYVINIEKGILSERMLRRLRFELFARMMRFRPERIRAVKPAEAASMIKDEVEPVGGFIGDAFIQPAFLGLQAMTALIFILVQSVWLGAVALAIVLVQAFLIPYLRREQLRLGRLRQLASRKLAGRIGEMIDTAPMIHVHGLKTRSEAEIGNRLGGLFDIRAALYKRKFAVKYLNNLLAQITPFFFYAIGGYFALRGTLDIGQLVAVIAAYRDLPPPVKELIDWDQRRADVQIKYEQVITQFAGETLLPDDPAPEEIKPIPADAPIDVRNVTVTDQRGTPLLASATLELKRPSHIAFVGSSSSGRDHLIRILGRQTSNHTGRVFIGKRSVGEMSDAEAARLMSFVPSDAIMFSGSIAENVAISLQRQPPTIEARNKRTRESELSGNPIVTDEGDWFDYRAADASDQSELKRRMVETLGRVGMRDDLYGFGMQERIPADASDELKAAILDARATIANDLAVSDMASLIEPFDFARFNDQMSLRENLLFGVLDENPDKPGWAEFNTFYQSVAYAEALYRPAIEMGLRIAETAVEVFADLPPGHPIFERFSMVNVDELGELPDLIRLGRADNGVDNLPSEAATKLIDLAAGYIEPRHRLGLITPELKERILRARKSIRRHLPEICRDQIEFYDAKHVITSAPIRDNLLFGRTA